MQPLLNPALLELHMNRATYVYPFEGDRAPASSAGLLSFLSIATYLCAGLIIVAFVGLLAMPDRASEERVSQHQEGRP